MKDIPGLQRAQRFRRATTVVALLCVATAASAQRQAINTGASVMTVRVYKGGVLSAFGHDHEIAAPAAGFVDLSAHAVEVRTRAGDLRVKDPGASESDRSKIQKTMLGPEVLDAERYPEITFRSTAAQRGAKGGWTVRGELTLHGQTRPIVVEVREEGGRYLGAARLNQTDFGMKPVKVAGGTVRVKDEVRIEFDIQLAK